MSKAPGLSKKEIETIRELEYSKGVKFPVTRYALKYRCTRCSREWGRDKFTKDETDLCPFGCSDPSLIVRLIRLLKHEDIEGYGELVSCEPYKVYL